MSLPRCPICHRPGIGEFQPFCSRRCADADLSNWLTNAYVLPVDDDDEVPDEIHDED